MHYSGDLTGIAVIYFSHGICRLFRSRLDYFVELLLGERIYLVQRQLALVAVDGRHKIACFCGFYRILSAARLAAVAVLTGFQFRNDAVKVRLRLGNDIIDVHYHIKAALIAFQLRIIALGGTCEKLLVLIVYPVSDSLGLNKVCCSRVLSFFKLFNLGFKCSSLLLRKYLILAGIDLSHGIVSFDLAALGEKIIYNAAAVIIYDGLISYDHTVK